MQSFSGHSPNFYPRPPRGGRPPALRESSASLLFLSTPSARRATRGGRDMEDLVKISIHALREEGDTPSTAFASRLSKFLSTPSARRATSTPVRRGLTATYFYPRPPRGGRPVYYIRLGTSKLFLSTPSARRATLKLQKREVILPISIHALREEGDVLCFGGWLILYHFYPRPPRGGRRP